MPNVDDENSGDMARVRRLQARLNEALREPIEERAKADYSPYAAHLGPDLVRKLHRAASPGGIEGLEAAMDAYDRLAQRGNIDPGRLRYALHLFLTHRDELDKLGLEMPSQ